MNNEEYLLEYPRFTKEMKKTHTILIPSMLDFHFEFICATLKRCGYKAEVLRNSDSSLVQEGLKYVHNDTCYPALSVIGQFLDALRKRDDIHNVALIITQTGGGCRATNYIPLLRKALAKSGMGFVPVMSLNAGNLEEGNGVTITPSLLFGLISAITYGDCLMYLYNKTRSYENVKGASLELANKWIKKLSEEIINKKSLSKRKMKKNLILLAKDFDNLPITVTNKPKVGIVGEIYVKYSSIGNNNLEQFLVDEGAEVLVPGVYGFLLYCLQNGIYDFKYYGGKRINVLIKKIVINFLARREKLMIDAVKKTKFPPMQAFKDTKDFCVGVIKHGAKMGEGWLLTAEMMELIHIGYQNIVCTQPFGCLPNHICGKGVMKKIKSLHPEANIVAIDYDPSATKVNQENRIKLMLAIAKEEINKQTA